MNDDEKATAPDHQLTVRALRDIPVGLNNSDWEHIFTNYTRAEDCRSREVTSGPYARKDVVHVIAIENGENDGASWIGVFEMYDGRFIFIEASCDYTGWGCQESGGSRVSGQLTELVALGMTREARARLAEQLRQVQFLESQP